MSKLVANLYSETFCFRQGLIYIWFSVSIHALFTYFSHICEVQRLTQLICE